VEPDHDGLYQELASLQKDHEIEMLYDVKTVQFINEALDVRGYEEDSYGSSDTCLDELKKLKGISRILLQLQKTDGFIEYYHECKPGCEDGDTGINYFFMSKSGTLGPFAALILSDGLNALDPLLECIQGEIPKISHNNKQRFHYRETAISILHVFC
jgi:hypothetical protein